MTGGEFTAIGSREHTEAEAGGRWRATLREQVYGLYVILDPSVTGGRDPLEVARAALRGGAHTLQLRDKVGDKGELLALARALNELCHEYHALLIINDYADLAFESEADGLHVGQTDLPVAEVRQVLHPWQLVGRSNHLVEQAVESQAQGADHVAIGSIYATSTKETGRPPVGLGPLRKVKELVSVPVVAIGGINEKNVAPVVQAGADAVCVASAVGLALDPEAAARGLVRAIAQAGGRV